jgi:hypothetical protein
MTRLHAVVATAGLGFLCAGCAGGQDPAPGGGGAPSAVQTKSYACEGCGKTLTVDATAAAPSC